MNPRQLAPAERNRLIAQAMEMRASGMQVQEIAIRMGVGRRTISYWTNLESREKTRARARSQHHRDMKRLQRQRARLREGKSGVHHYVYPDPARADYQARMAEIPEDTRSLTGILCGDPVISRSALAKKRKLEDEIHQTS